MSDQPSVASVDTAVVPSPGYYPDPSVPGFVRYWNGGAWVPGTSRPAPAAGEVLEVPRFAVRPNPRPNARYIPPPVVVLPAQEAAETVETGPVFLDETAAGAAFTIAPELADGSAWRADPQAQRGLMETGTAPRWVSWGVVEAPGAEVEVEVRSERAEVEVAVAVAPVVVPAVVPAPVEPVPVPVPVRVPAVVSAVVSEKSARPTSQTVQRNRQAAPRPVKPVRPAGLGRRAAARLLDGLVLAAVAAATALPFVADTEAHVQVRVAQARAASQLTGREVQVWLLDGVVLGRLGLLLGVLLLVGFLGEVLPTARTGRTLGKRLLGLRVVRTDARRPPTLGRSLGRWLVGQLSVLTLVGLLAVLVDRQGRRGWHDRVAGTKVVEG
ncbi:putative RDD family membrane protein YckC [Kitasatospora sp. MAA4]|uniref:RDD family protein n=1 Tax=Kitasatospora sp. MAA4 TaxID=3035093 RepID=UPI002477249E|nr:RDD family protein [Kitasatospora sp. MAA4]MDH6135247.1 putative RDD family membrane protein YckC [Kitasatospora sp. MAA4]